MDKTSHNITTMDRTPRNTDTMDQTSPRTFGRTELACLYFPCLQPQSAWLKLRLLLLDSPSLAPLALMRRRFFLPAEARLIMEQLGEP